MLPLVVKITQCSLQLCSTQSKARKLSLLFCLAGGSIGGRENRTKSQFACQKWFLASKQFPASVFPPHPPFLDGSGRRLSAPANVFYFRHAQVVVHLRRRNCGVDANRLVPCGADTHDSLSSHHNVCVYIPRSQWHPLLWCRSKAVHAVNTLLV